MPRLILASASPRRLALLAQIGVVPDAVIATDIDETPHPREAARDCVLRLAAGKAAAVDAGPDDVVLAADTIVTAGRRILGKPETETEAEAFLRLLSGRRHRVLTGIAVRRGDRESVRLVETIVRFRALTHVDISDYISSGEWRGKAGGYAIQGRAAAFAPWLQGSFSAVVGLPLAETAMMLRTAGIRASIQSEDT